MEDKEQMFICACSSLEHQLFFWWDYGSDMLYVESHLHSNRNFWGRLKYALKYVFGHKSNYGSWDEFLFSEESLTKLQTFLNNLKDGKEEE